MRADGRTTFDVLEPRMGRGAPHAGGHGGTDAVESRDVSGDGVRCRTGELVRFGPDDQLVGVLTGAAGPSDLTLLLPSAGLQPRSGPFRLHVELGERLAGQGVRTFRFDAPGVGEAPRLGGYDANAAAIDAMDAIERLHGPGRFAIGGICSAADIGWHAAVRDARVGGLLQIDGIAFRGPWYGWAKALDRVRRVPTEWRRMLRDRRAGGGAPSGMDSSDFRDWPAQDEAVAQFAQLVARGTRMLWVYTGGYTDRMLHRRQFRWAYGRPAASPGVELAWWPDCDHTFYARAHRDRLVGRIADWIQDLDGRLERRP